MSKQMTNSWYTTKFKSEEEKKGYDVTVKPCMTPEKKLLYEVFALLETHICNPSRVDFDISYVKSIEKNITVLLKREVLEP